MILISGKTRNAISAPWPRLVRRISAVTRPAPMNPMSKIAQPVARVHRMVMPRREFKSEMHPGRACDVT